jgi:hypothetical protein
VKEETPSTRAFLHPISDREALAWIIRERRTAFGENRAREAAALEPGDALFLYTTRGCFRNPTRDRGRVVARAVVRRRQHRAARVPGFRGHEYPYVVALDIEALAPFRSGLELAPLVPRLQATFPDPATWSIRMRRALVPLSEGDAKVLGAALQEWERPYELTASGYELSAEVRRGR